MGYCRLKDDLVSILDGDGRSVGAGGLPYGSLWFATTSSMNSM